MAEIKKGSILGANTSFDLGNIGTIGEFNRARPVVDLTPAITQPKVVREGFKVPTVALDLAKSTFFLDNLTLANPKDEPRVLLQSVPAGTRVPPGTTVDLTLAPARSIKFEIFENPHKDLATRPITDLTEGILQDADIRQTLLKYDTPDEVPAADKTKLINEFRTKANVTVNDASADTSFEAAFNTMRGALAFR